MLGAVPTGCGSVRPYRLLLCFGRLCQGTTGNHTCDCTPSIGHLLGPKQKTTACQQRKQLQEGSFAVHIPASHGPPFVPKQERCPVHEPIMLGALPIGCGSVTPYQMLLCFGKLCQGITGNHTCDGTPTQLVLEHHEQMQQPTRSLIGFICQHLLSCCLLACDRSSSSCS
jgi:hypothetical protein